MCVCARLHTNTCKRSPRNRSAQCLLPKLRLANREANASAFRNLNVFLVCVAVYGDEYELADADELAYF